MWFNMTQLSIYDMIEKEKEMAINFVKKVGIWYEYEIIEDNKKTKMEFNYIPTEEKIRKVYGEWKKEGVK